MQKRCARNRKRSQRRAILCPQHGCYLDSVSPKFPLFADSAGQLQVRGMGAKTARLVINTHGTVPLSDEWLEAFWCSQCQASQWYHVRKLGDRQYQVQAAPAALWRQVSGVIDPHRNPSISEFSDRAARGRGGYAAGLKSFRQLA